MTTNNEFRVRGYVGRNIYRKSAENWSMTNFTVSVYKGKNKDGKNEYINVPVTCWFNADVEAGDEVVVTGTISLRKDKNNEKQMNIQLLADNVAGVCFVKKSSVASAVVSMDDEEDVDDFLSGADGVMGAEPKDIPF